MKLKFLPLCIIAFSAFYFSNPKIIAEKNPSTAELAKDLAIPAGSFLVFDSNRNGTFGIFKLDLFSGKTTELADTPRHEMYPDVSPDGKQLVYARHKTLEREDLGSIILSNIDGSKAEIIAKQASFPTFTSDGKEIIFEVKRKRVMKYNIETKETVRIFPTRKFAKQFNIVTKARLSQSGKWLSFTSDRPHRWTNWYIDLENKKAFHGPAGCEGVVNAKDDALYYVMPGTQGSLAGSGIFKFDFATQSRVAEQDEPGPWGHEYFPSFTKGDSFMAYSACPEDQHSAIDSNYQLYIKNNVSGKSHKFTFDEFNNRWAKLFLLKQ